MRTDEIFIAFLVSPIVITFTSYCLGFLVLKACNISLGHVCKPLFSLLIGILLINVLTSIVLTNFITVQLLVGPLLFVLWRSKRKELIISQYNWKSFRTGLSLLSIFLGIWIIFYFVAYYAFIFDHEKIQTFYLDIYYFVRIAENIWIHGQENIMNTLNQMDSFSGGATNYHYVELYQTLLLSKPFGLNSLWGFTISLPIFFSAIGSLTVFTFLRSANQGVKLGLAIFVSFLTMFISGCNLLPIDYTENGAYSMNMINNVLPKYFPIFLPALLAGFFISKKQYLTAVVIISMIVAFTFTMIPVVLLLGMGGIVLLKVFQEIDWAQTMKLTLILIGSVGFVLVFYRINAVAPEYQRLDTNYFQVILGFIQAPSPVLKRWLGTHVYYVFDYFLFLAPFGVFLLYTWKSASWKKYLRIVGFFLLLFEGGVIATTLLDGYHTQAWQPQYITLTVGSNLFLLLVFIDASQHHQTFSKIFGSLILLVCFVNFWKTISHFYIYNDDRMAQYDLSKDFFEEIRPFLESSEKQMIAFIEEKPVLPAIYPIGSTLTHANPNLDLECIDKSVLLQKNENYLLCTFREFVNNSLPTTDDTHQLKYISEFQIRYVIGYEKNETYNFLKSFSKEVLTDELSGLYMREINLEKISQHLATGSNRNEIVR